MRRWAALLVLAWLPARAAAGATPAPTVARVELSGDPEGERVAGSVPLRAGDRATPAILAKSVLFLYDTGRYAQVAALTDEAGPGRVNVVFAVERSRPIVRVEMNGVEALSETALYQAAALPPGTEFSPARVTGAARAIARAYFRAGYRDAVVRWDATDLKRAVAIDFSVVEGQPTTLVRFDFFGDFGLTEPELHGAFDLQPGDRLDLDRVERGLNALRARYRQQGFYRAKVLPPTVIAADDLGLVEVRVEAGPRYRLQVRGAKSFSARMLLSQLDYQGQRPLDRGVEEELARKLQTFYELAGFPDARVAVRESAPPPGVGSSEDEEQPRGLVSFDHPEPGLPPARSLRAHRRRIVTFLVREGRPREVHRREYPGLRFFRPSQLDQRIDQVLRDAVPEVLKGGRSEALLQASFASGDGAPQAKSPRTVVPAEVFAPEVYGSALSELQDLYRSEGFLDASLGPARLVEGQGLDATVVIPIQEGPRTLVSRVGLTGVRAFTRAELEPLLTVHPRDPLSFAAIEKMRQAVQGFYQDKGYAFAEVDDSEKLNDAGTEAAVELKVTEGPLVRVSKLVLKGVQHTDVKLVEANLVLEPGDPITPKAREACVQNLMRLGVFSSASVEMADPDLMQPEKPLVVEVREKPRFLASLSGGISYADGPRASANASWGNLFGENRTATVGLKINWPVFRICLVEDPQSCTADSLPVPLEWRVNAAMLMPQLQAAGKTPIDLRFDAIYENLLRPSYHLSQTALLASLGRLLHRRLFGHVESNLLVEAEIEYDGFEKPLHAYQPQFVTQADRMAMLLPTGRFFLGSLRPTLTLDGRDDQLNPTRGFMFGLGLDLTRSFYAVDSSNRPFQIELLRTDAQLNGYIPLNRRHRVVLALAGRVGWIFAPSQAEVIGTKRFFLGGSQSLRGFYEDELVPEDVRSTLHAAIDRCNALVSGLGCDATSEPGPNGFQSQGGSASVLGRVELRFPLTAALDGGVFVDAGNLWSDPAKVDLTRLRYSVGAGLRYPLPIGPVALDVGINPNRDIALGEPLYHINFAVGLF